MEQYILWCGSSRLDILPKVVSDYMLRKAHDQFWVDEVDCLEVLQAPPVGPTVADLVWIWDRDGLSFTQKCFFLSVEHVGTLLPASPVGLRISMQTNGTNTSDKSWKPAMMFIAGTNTWSCGLQPEDWRLEWP